MPYVLSEGLLREIRAEFPAFRILPKDGHKLSACIDLALRVLTFGRQRSFLTRYHTVLGETLYVPAVWADSDDITRTILLRHERVHLRQRRRYGSCVMVFIYLIPWVPIGLAWGRARIEWEAYRETLRATAELRGAQALHSAELRRFIVDRFTGPDYGWMWPFRRQVEGWIGQAIQEIDASVGPGSPERQARGDWLGHGEDRR